MTSPDSISVVIPAFEAEATLRETVASVLRQGHADVEVLVVDDGSTQPASRIVDELDDPRVRCLRKTNTGVSDSRNVGLRNTDGTLVLFLDADDVLGEDFFSARLAALRSDPAASGAASTVVRIDADGRHLPSPPLRSATRLEDLTRYATDTISCPSGYLFRRAALDAHGLVFDPRLASSADRFFLLCLFQSGHLAEAQDGPLHYRVAASSMSHRLTRSLVTDREAFVAAVREAGLVPAKDERRFFARQYYTLAASSHHLGDSRAAVRYAVRSILRSPRTFVRLLRR